MTIRVVVADDHPMYRFGLTAVLDQSDDVEVVASVPDGAELLRAVPELRPDVVITDLTMPGLDGVTATRRLLEASPELPVLVLTMHEDDEHVFAAASGGAVYGGSVARRIVAFYSGDDRDSATARAFPALTPREREVLELIAVGCRNHEIARRLTMSEKTVRNHVSQVLTKLQVPDRTAAALRARDTGIG